MPTDSERLLLYVSPSARAVLLYGSRARGDHRPDSDTDVVQILPDAHASETIEGITLSNYTFPQLCSMATRGSLFVAHLILEAVPVRDPENLLLGLRESYRPASYAYVLQELGWAVRLLTDSVNVYRRRPTKYHRLVLSLARTYAYATAQHRGVRTFSMDALWKRFEGIWGPPLPRFEQLSWSSYLETRTWIEARLGQNASNPFKSVEALIVNALGHSRLCVALGLRLLHDGETLPPYEETDLWSEA